MDGWIDYIKIFRWLDGRKFKLMKRWMYGRIFRWMDGKM